MSSTLSEGVRVPDIGSTSWGADVNYNWTLLNTALANISGNVKTDVENTWTATQTFSETISGSIDGVATRAVGDEDGNNIKAALAGKQSSLSQAQLDACNSGITAAAVQQIADNANAIAGKAADADVVHLAGAETITGNKTFTGSPLTLEGNMAIYWNRPQVTVGTLPSSGVYYGTTRYRDSAGASFVMQRGSINSSGELDYGIFLYPWSAASATKGISLYTSADGSSAWLRPVGTGLDLGTSTNKWKTLNGINPGDLGRVKETDYVSIDTTNWSLSSANHLYINGANPTYPGWLYVRINNATTSDKLYARIGGTSTSLPGVVAAYMDGGYFMLFCPVAAGQTINVYTTIAPSVCRYYACLGNV